MMPYLIPLIYVLLFFAIFFAVILIRKRLKPQRWPVQEPLMRGPGEHLLQTIMQRREDDLEQAVKNVMLPLVAAGLPILASSWVPKEKHWVLPLCSLLLFVVFVTTRVRALVRWLVESRNYELGYYGERMVAQYLEPLKAQDFGVFHDVPGKAGKQDFNLDHVTVGRTGVALIETKARQKKAGRPGYVEHEVTYDGQQLIWPWGEETAALDQTRRNAVWLRAWLKERTGKDFPVNAVLAFPGWMVRRKGKGDVWVVNPKELEKTLGKGKPVLSDEEIDLIKRQLDSICRNVEL